MGLHLHLHPHGNENWEYAQGITKFCVHNVSLLGVDHHRCSRHQQGADFARYGPIRLASLYCFQSAARNSHSFRISDNLTYPTLNPTVRYVLTTAYRFTILILVIARHGPSNAPEPPFTCDFLPCYRHNAIA